MECSRILVLNWHSLKHRCTEMDNWNKFEIKRSKLRRSYERWKPSGEVLITYLRKSAYQLDSGKWWKNWTDLIGGVTGLGGAGLAGIGWILSPPLATVGYAVSATGAITGLVGFGARTWHSNFTQNLLNKMIEEKEAGYKELKEAAEDLKNFLQSSNLDVQDPDLDQVKFLDLNKAGENAPEIELQDTGRAVTAAGWTERLTAAVPWLKDATIQQASNVNNTLKGYGVNLAAAGRVVGAVGYTDKLLQAMPWLTYLESTNKVLKAAMIKQAVTVNNLLKATGVSGAAAKAARLTEIQHATAAYKVAREAVKPGMYTMSLSAVTAVVAVADIIGSLNDLANGSVTATSVNYRHTADSLEMLMVSVQQLLDIDKKEKKQKSKL